jgi:tryptophan halogenase
VIVGGGTAGWLSASYLNRALGTSVEITLVESDRIGRIGVGEATVPTLRHTMHFLGLEDRDWMPKCAATYKTGIRYEQWQKPLQEGSEYFYHPFFPRQEPMYGRAWFPEVGDGLSAMHAWHRRALKGDPTPYAYAAFPGPALSDACKAPRTEAGDYAVVTAYHLDAGLLGAFLRDLAIERGVKHVVDDVVDTQLDDQGFIQSIRTASGVDLHGDLFLDCTGFRSLLVGDALGSEFKSDASALLCDRAIATRPEHPPGELRPYTVARTASAGWMWDIPLFHRAGCGYVYSSAEISDDEAEAELRRYIGDRSIEADPLRLRFSTGSRTPWIKNCVGLGLSVGFLEPLESTTIFLIEYGLANLVATFPDREFEPARTDRYNRVMAQMYEEIRDFIVLHYVGSPRRDTAFWRRVAEDTVMPDTLQTKLAYYRTSLPQGEQFQNFVFRERSYACILTGLGIVPPRVHPLLNHIDFSAGEEALDANAAAVENLLSALPSHREYLRTMYREAGYLQRYE